MEVSLNKSTLDFTHMLGPWKNSYISSKGIASFELTANGSGLDITLKGESNGLVPGDWGTAPLSPFAYKPQQEKADGFIGNISTAEFDAFLCIYNNKGLIILEAVIQFKENEELNNWLVREFFYHQK